jgi:hypothetical protein
MTPRIGSPQALLGQRRRYLPRRKPEAGRTATAAACPVRWVGADPQSDSNECPAVAVMPETGDFLFRGKTVTDMAVITVLNQHIGKADDESDVWLPARMAPLIREALDGYEQDRHGPGQHTLAQLMAAARACVIRFEVLADGEDTDPPAAARASGTAAGEPGDDDTVRAVIARGVQVRRLQVVPAGQDLLLAGAQHPQSGTTPREDVRQLSRSSAARLLLPGADCWVFDYRVIRWDFRDADPAGSRCCAFSSDPRVIRDIAAVFELAWSKATTAE